MLEFPCVTCGKRVQAEEAFAGKQVLCPVCHRATAAPPPSQTAIASAAPASARADDAGAAELPPLPSIRKEVPRIVMRWVPLGIVIGVLGLIAAILIPAIVSVRESRHRVESTNKLKNIGLAFHSFHDCVNRLPYNGTVPALPGNNATGSWALQIIPYIDQAPNAFRRLNAREGVPEYMCPGRGRPPHCTTGAWTDYCINPWINDHLNGAVDAPDEKRTMAGITDGTSNTIFVGQGNIDPDLYASTVAIPQSCDIFQGGQPATARRSTIQQRDKAGVGDLTWGGPFSQGTLMCMGDGTVRLFPYSTHSGGVIQNGVSTILNPGLGAFLTPAGGENVELPD